MSRCLVEIPPQRHRAVEHLLARNAPLELIQLQRQPVPHTVRADGGEVLVGELLPPVVLAEIVEQAGLELKQPGKLRDELPGLMATERRANHGEHVPERVVAGQDLHRRPRSVVRRAQHQDARAVHLHHPIPCVASLQLHRPRDEPAHRVRQHANRLAGCLARGERGVDGIGQEIRCLFNRPPPVEGERDHVVVLGEVGRSRSS